MTSYPACNNTSLSRKPCIADKMLGYQEVMIALSESVMKNRLKHPLAEKSRWRLIWFANRGGETFKRCVAIRATLWYFIALLVSVRWNVGGMVLREESPHLVLRVHFSSHRYCRVAGYPHVSSPLRCLFRRISTSAQQCRPSGCDSATCWEAVHQVATTTGNYKHQGI